MRLSMRIAVMSDSHGRKSRIEKVLEAQPLAEAAIFLGDGLDDFEETAKFYPSLSYYSVGGNCDYFYRENTVKLITLAEKRIFLTHGHMHGVKGGYGNIICSARENQADILLFGHTHLPYISYENGLHIMNPGALSRPSAGRESYGVIDITPAGIVLFNIYI